MKAERRRQIQEVFEAAADLVPSERTAFLDAACAGDSDLRVEVESLLAADTNAGGFMENPVLRSRPASGNGAVGRSPSR